MPKKTSKKMSTSKRAEITETRKEYERLKRVRHLVGKKAFGKPESSTVKKDYRTVDRAYARVGSKLGRLTGAHKGR